MEKYYNVFSMHIVLNVSLRGTPIEKSSMRIYKVGAHHD